MINNVIFDLGNVLLYYKPEELLLKYTEDKKRIDVFLSKVPRSDTWWQLDQGLISMKEAEQIFINKYPEELDLLIPFLNHWMNILTPIEENVILLRDLKQRKYKVFALSNFIKEAFEFVSSKYDFFSLLDGRVISSEEKVIKPDKAIYQILLKRYDLEAKNCIFLDDVPGFLKPAKELGMSTILVRPGINLRQKLRKFNIKI